MNDKLTMRESMAFCCVSSPTGLRCPSCGKWIRSDDRRKRGTIVGKGIILSLTPGCVHCETEGEQE